MIIIATFAQNVQWKTRKSVTGHGNGIAESIVEPSADRISKKVFFFFFRILKVSDRSGAHRVRLKYNVQLPGTRKTFHGVLCVERARCTMKTIACTDVWNLTYSCGVCARGSEFTTTGLWPVSNLGVVCFDEKRMF